MTGRIKPTLAIYLVLMALAGCDRASHERYIPAAPLAREALTAAMDSWLRGEDRARLPAGKPQIELIDSQREGRRLARYEILGELSIEGGRRFDVRLHLADPEQVETVQYIVLGIDPLWVMQKRDYDMVTHWDMPMDEPEKKPSSEKKSDE
jgi:hypothetical protein